MLKNKKWIGIIVGAVMIGVIVAGGMILSTSVVRTDTYLPAETITETTYYTQDELSDSAKNVETHTCTPNEK